MKKTQKIAQKLKTRELVHIYLISGFRIRILNADPEPGGKMKLHPCGSGSTALVAPATHFLHFRLRANSSYAPVNSGSGSYSYFKTCYFYLKAVLWIQIRIRSVFRRLVDPDPYSQYKYGSVSTHVVLYYIPILYRIKLRQKACVQFRI